jgi:hypothetical protein
MGIVTEIKRLNLVKPTPDTLFHIDFNWWQKNDQDWRIFLRNYLCVEHQQVFADLSNNIEVDWVDPITAEVQRVDGMQHALITHCAKQVNFITPQTALVDGVFRVFLSNGNVPLSPNQLADYLGRPGILILKTLSGIQVHKGLRPCIV